MTEQEIFEKLQDIIIEKWEGSRSRKDITRETDLVTDLEADSLDVLELFMDIEKNFNITFTDGEFADLGITGKGTNINTFKIKTVVILIKRKWEEARKQERELPKSNAVLFFMTSKRVKPR